MSVLTENGGFDLRMSHLSLNLLAVFGENGGGSIGQRPRAAVVERQSNDKSRFQTTIAELRTSSGIPFGFRRRLVDRFASHA